jgi:NAD(P)-dependent dehydrogenase (short-subunit alcohol dehydrogenase family)
LEAADSFAPALDAAWQRLGRVDAVILTAAHFGAQAALEQDAALRLRLLTANFAHSVEFLEQARQRLLAQGGGRLVAFSSVAGDRGRSPVTLYGATKAGLSHYMEGVDHRYRRRGIISICVKPGFVRTGMTDGLPAPPFAGQPDAVASAVLRAIDRGQPVLYTPGPWRAVMAVVRHLPRFVMRRATF